MTSTPARQVQGGEARPQLPAEHIALPLKNNCGEVVPLKRKAHKVATPTISRSFTK